MTPEEITQARIDNLTRLTQGLIAGGYVATDEDLIEKARLLYDSILDKEGLGGGVV